MTVDEALLRAVDWGRDRRNADGRARLGFVVPGLTPYAGLLLQRLRAEPPVALRVHVVGGLPLRGTPAGRPIRRLLRALREDLVADRLIELLPSLRRGVSDAAHGDAQWEPRMARTRAAAIVYESGSDLSPAGPHRWAERFRLRLTALRRDIDRSLSMERADRAAQRTLAVERQRAERWVRDVTPIVAALGELDSVCDLVDAGACLAEIWVSIAAFAQRWLQLPPDPPGALAAVGARVDELVARGAAADQCGWDGLVSLLDHLGSVRCETHPLADADAVIADRSATLPPGLAAVLHVAEGSDADQFESGAGVVAIVATSSGRLPSRPVAVAESPAIDASRVAALLADRRRALHVEGDLGGARELTPIPGLTPARPLSASALGMLLGCPHRFLQERILRRHAVAELPATDGLDPVVYGTVFHAAAEQLFAAAGPDICRRDGDLARWSALGREVAEAAFEATLHRYPLWGAANIERERCRLHGQVQGLVEEEWQRGARTFLASEWRFGEPDAVAIGTAEATIFVRGSMDRLDLQPSGALSVRDLKTGWLAGGEHPGFNPARDLQLGVYVLVLESVGFAGCREVEEALFVRPTAEGCTVRRFAGPQLDTLRRATQEALSVAHVLLTRGVFPRTPNSWECRHCPFLPACGQGAHARAAAYLGGLPCGDPLRTFERFKAVSREG